MVYNKIMKLLSNASVRMNMIEGENQVGKFDLRKKH